MILYRPVGTAELELIKQSNYTEFPPRLPEQPIFYPVMNEEYACEIADKWNTKVGDGKGYVTRFHVDDDYLKQFDVHTVGNHTHQELWIPAEELSTFNQHIIGLIEVIKEFSGDVTKINDNLNFVKIAIFSQKEKSLKRLFSFLMNYTIKCNS